MKLSTARKRAAFSDSSYNRKHYRSLYEDDYAEDDAPETADQAISSAATSINKNKLPAVFNKVSWEPGTINLDWGGGKFDNATEFLKTKGVENLIYDPFNRPSAHNSSVLAKVKKNGGADTVTCSNVLNVIAEDAARLACIKNCHKYLRTGGTAYFTVYEGDKSGKGKQTSSDGYQLNRKTADYVEEIASVFASVNRKGQVIIARK